MIYDSERKRRVDVFGTKLIFIHDGKSTALGVRETFADVAAMLADFFGVRAGK
jgi:phosphopentomutase